MLARLCQHIPPPGFHLTRLYGAYANRSRGARARLSAGAGERPSSGDGEPDTPAQRERRREWAKLIARVFEVDPLRCRCGGTMRVVAFILDPAVIRRCGKAVPSGVRGVRHSFRLGAHCHDSR
jgi:hypothetical protein